ncbi:MAG: hypothetical protein AUK28_04010 [Desulfobacterales bacterium CG2_30_60_27]|nr:MAG: hypothetical protein AUK28_04010 [Desulfobacterales bacterium CG2_30_60_27]
MNRSNKSDLEFKTGTHGRVPGKAMAVDADEAGVRRAFRLPSVATANVVVEVNGKAYEVVDICRDGVGLRIAKDAPFPVAGEKVRLTVSLAGTAYDASGRIIHVSPDFSDQYLCGIQFVDLKAKFLETLTTFLEARRLDWFADQQG